MRQQVEPRRERLEADRVRECGDRQYDQAHGEEHEHAEERAAERRFREQARHTRGDDDKERRPQERQDEVRGEAQHGGAPAAGVGILPEQTARDHLQELLRAGASAYVLKQSPPTELLQAIRATGAGGQYVDSSLTARVTAGFLGREGRAGGRGTTAITEREAEVLRLIASGYSNKEIAQQLDLSVKTVEAHKANAMRKLDLNSRIDIVRYAMLQGWLHNA